VPRGEVADVKLSRGDTTIRTENGQFAVYIFVDIATVISVDMSRKPSRRLPRP
jgi:Cu/Ag efflux pump CusA